MTLEQFTNAVNNHIGVTIQEPIFANKSGTYFAEWGDYLFLGGKDDKIQVWFCGELKEIDPGE